MTVQKGEQYTKQVDFVAKDADEQIATGIVMVPDKVDRQGDFVREDTIREFASQFENFIEAGEADGGVMHAVWPSDWMTLERNEVLDEPAQIGGQTAPAGAWIQSWQFHDDELWSLVDDGVLEGNSIGAIDVDWNGPMEQDELPDDVEVADDYPDGEFVWELVSGLIREVSTVDIPAVPDAMILETKAGASKRLADHLGNRDGFIEEAQTRGHSEEAAERLWELLNRAVDIEGAGEPGKQSMFARAGKAFLSALTGSEDDQKASSATHGRGSEKEGRTLSQANRDALFASIDSQLDVLTDAGVEHGMTRFTDRDDVDFDLEEYAGRTWTDDDGGKQASTDKDAPDGDTSDPNKTDMSDDDDLSEKFDALEKRIDELEESTDKNDDGTDDGGDGAKSVEEKVDELAKQIEELAKASGQSQQLAGGTEPESKTSKADVLGLPGGDN